MRVWDSFWVRVLVRIRAQFSFRNSVRRLFRAKVYGWSLGQTGSAAADGQLMAPAEKMADGAYGGRDRVVDGDFDLRRGG